MEDLSSRKFLLTIAYLVMGVVFVLLGKLDAMQFLVAAGTVTGLYHAANIADKVVNNQINNGSPLTPSALPDPAPSGEPGN